MDKNFDIVTALTDQPADVKENLDEVESKSQPSEVPISNVFERYINQITITAFGFTLQSGWEGIGLTFQFAWQNGGPAAILYGSIIAGIGSTLVAMSLGEMASMDPAVGAQYRWSARFATRAPRFWGFIQGWITVFAWICNCAGATAVSSNTVSGLIVFNKPDYEPKKWHATLLLISFTVVTVVLNLKLRRVIRVVESVSGVFHVVFFAVTVVTLAVLAKKSTAKFVFNTLHNDSGWDNPGVAFSIGMLPTAYVISSFDGVLHMIDETKEPRKRVPRAMVFATASNAMMQTVFCICLLFCIGDVDAVSTSFLPIAGVFYSATGSRAASTVLVVMMASICAISTFNVVASVSRLVWAFARDKGLPFHQYFTYIHPTLQIPLPALILVCTIVCLLSLINLGSPVAFNALIALPTIALYISYIIPITLLTLRQLAGKHPRYGPWRLGRWSVPVKLCALVYLVYVVVFIPFPTSRPVTGMSMNYAGPVFLGAVGIALVYWCVNGRKRFVAPTGVLEYD